MSSANIAVTHVDLPASLSSALQRVLADGDTVAGAPETDAKIENVTTNLADANEASAGVVEADVNNETALVKQVPSSPEPWDHLKKRMERLNAAIEQAMAIAVPEDKEPVTEKSNPVENRSIDVSLDNGPQYMIPWKACHTWLKMETFLLEWFKEDEKALKDISSKNFTLRWGDALIHPSVWETVLSPGCLVKFSRKLPSGASTPRSKADEPKDVKETEYENRVQYKVRRFRTSPHSDRIEFEGATTHKEPVEFEVANEHEKLPALEEVKTITSQFGSLGKDEKKTGLPKLHTTDVVDDAELKIHSPYLLNVLKAVIEYSAEAPAGNYKGLDAGVFPYPYRDLYHHLDDLQTYKTGSSELRARHSEAFNQKADQHIDLLQTYLESQPTIRLAEAKARWSRPTPVTTFAAFWLLMKPGTDVYVKEKDGSLSRYVLDKLKGGIKGQTGKRVTKEYTAELWNLQKGSALIWQYSREVEVPVFDDEKKIVDLPVFPCRFHDKQDKGALRQALIDRGKKYFEYSTKPYFLQYTGHGEKPGLKMYKRARVVVDHASAPWDEEGWGKENNRHFPFVPDDEDIAGSVRVARCECVDCEAATEASGIYPRAKFSEYEKIHPKKNTTLTEHQYLLMPSHMFAFVLKDRAYDLLDVSKLELPSMNDTAIERLVIHPENKQLIKAVAKTYTDEEYTDKDSPIRPGTDNNDADNKETDGTNVDKTEDNRPKRFSADFIYGKGEGQIILLHGSPGTGKTLTAESVAEFTKRPLLSITAADLGHEPDALEQSLLRYFRRANDWDAIVLLDEADVYLEKRSTSDLKRNSIVSVFLRALDYFQGILFLTTNRVGQFDEAFMSRIHLALGYDKLTNDARAQIWTNLFQKLKDDYKNGDGPKITYDYDAKAYVTRSEEIKTLEWNGREIRNAFQTAVALAVYDAKPKPKNGDGTPAVPEVTEHHIKQVVSMSAAFRQYIMKTHEGMDDSTLAFKFGNRDDQAPSTPAAKSRV